MFKRLLDRWEKESVNFREQEIRNLLLSALFYYGSPVPVTFFFSSEHKKTISEGGQLLWHTDQTDAPHFQIRFFSTFRVIIATYNNIQDLGGFE